MASLKTISPSNELRDGRPALWQLGQPGLQVLQALSGLLIQDLQDAQELGARDGIGLPLDALSDSFAHRHLNTWQQLLRQSDDPSQSSLRSVKTLAGVNFLWDSYNDFLPHECHLGSHGLPTAYCRVHLYHKHKTAEAEIHDEISHFVCMGQDCLYNHQYAPRMSLLEYLTVLILH